MKAKDYFIEFNKLKSGENTFNFIIDDKFLSEFPFSPVKQANTNVALNLLKREMIMELEFIFLGTAHVECDTCLNEIELPVNATYNLLIKKAEESNFTDDEIIYIGKNETELNLMQYLYESFLLSLPPKKGCQNIPEPKPCNFSVLEKLKNQEVIEAKEGKEEHEADPRWEKLKNILKNN
ncbi:MAG: YceD family protein [Bacteroidia bacterium]